MIATIILLVLIVMDLTASLILHGKDKGEWNFWTCLLADGILLALFYWAGLFDKFNM